VIHNLLLRVVYALVALDVMSADSSVDPVTEGFVFDAELSRHAGCVF